jgi:heme/copper-type cytochrome/quinol oxidase subunit 2
MNRIKVFLATSSIPAILVTGFFRISTALAQTPAPPPNLITDQGDLSDLFCNFIGYFFWIVIVISVIMVLVAAYDYVTAGDDTEKTTRGRKRLTYAAVGIAIALLAFASPLIVLSIFPNSSGSTSTIFNCQP